jgi:hypothetical protein
MTLDRLDLDAGSFTRGTGWAIKPESAYKGEMPAAAARPSVRPRRRRRAASAWPWST